MNDKVYRIRVEQRPSENFKRYFPEHATKFDHTGETIPNEKLKWYSVAGYLETNQYRTENEAQRRIDEDIAYYNKQIFTEKIIEYNK